MIVWKYGCILNFSKVSNPIITNNIDIRQLRNNSNVFVFWTTLQIKFGSILSVCGVLVVLVYF